METVYNNLPDEIINAILLYDGFPFGAPGSPRGFENLCIHRLEDRH
jgi:hypothetical protein